VIQSQRDTELEECRVRDNYTESEGYKVSGIQSQRDTEPDRYKVRGIQSQKDAESEG
jgi:hypothetical protein